MFNSAKFLFQLHRFFVKINWIEPVDDIWIILRQDPIWQSETTEILIEKCQIIVIPLLLFWPDIISLRRISQRTNDQLQWIFFVVIRSPVWPDWAILKILGRKDSYKNGPNIFVPFWLFWKHPLLSKNCCSYFWATFYSNILSHCGVNHLTLCFLFKAKNNILKTDLADLTSCFFFSFCTAPSMPFSTTKVPIIGQRGSEIHSYLMKILKYRIHLQNVDM